MNEEARLILLRHGESVWNLEGRFTGWTDVALSLDDERHPRFDPRYGHLRPDELPGTESLQDTLARVLVHWHESVVPELRRGRKVLISAHGNSLRALVKHLDDISDGEISELNIPNAAAPQPLPLPKEWGVRFGDKRARLGSLSDFPPTIPPRGEER